jgi:UDP-N-acetylmuramoylalanine--D-glutamate ligase
VSNALAAAAAAIAFGAAPDAVSVALTTFRPIPHRLEPVGEIDGVEYFNDSKATNPDAVLKALTAFSGRPIVLLLGGRNKGNDFHGVARASAACCRCVIAFGEARHEIISAFSEGDTPVRSAPSMREALGLARACAHSGDAVVLSPACASFDEFKDYTERGDVFRESVSIIAGRASGGVLS